MYLNYQFFEGYIEENDNDQEYLNSPLYKEQLKYFKIIIISYKLPFTRCRTVTSA